MIASCAWIRPGFVIYTQHIDDRHAEEPFSTLLTLGTIAPFVLVPVALLALLVARRWTATEKVVLWLMPVGWLAPLYLAPMSFGCSDVGGAAQPCAVTPVSGPREVVVLALAGAVSCAVVWVAASRLRRPPRPLRA